MYHPSSAQNGIPSKRFEECLVIEKSVSDSEKLCLILFTFCFNYSKIRTVILQYFQPYRPLKEQTLFLFPFSPYLKQRKCTVYVLHVAEAFFLTKEIFKKNSWFCNVSTETWNSTLLLEFLRISRNLWSGIPMDS